MRLSRDISFFSILIAALCFFTLTGCKPEEEDQTMVIPDEDIIPLESFGVTFYFADSANTRAKLETPHVIEKEIMDEDGKAVMVNYFDQGVKIQFYDRFEKVESTVVSDSGSFMREQGLAELYSNVVVNNIKNEQLETEQLFWDQKIDSVYTHKFVKITTPDRIITGRRGLRSNTKFTQYTIFGIQGEMEMEDELE